LAGDNAVAVGDHLPTIPDHQVKAGGLFKATPWLDLGVDGRFIGQQWLRGDEANQTRPLDSYFVMAVRAGLSLGAWEVNGVVNNLFNSHRAVFGTFNQNRQSGELERFLSPMNARSLKVVVSRSFGSNSD
jgi:iron complex outermembrane receptor protein